MNVEAQIRGVFEKTFADGTPWHHPNAPIVIAATKGRCVHVRLSGEPEWSFLAEDLIGDGKPCTEFRLDGRNLFARLKTIEQRAADDAATDYDDAHGELHTWGWPEFGAEPAKPAKKEKRRKVPEGAATVVMQVMERDGDSDIDDLIDAVRAILPPKIDGEGKDRTTRYIRAAIEKLEQLEYVSVEDRHVSLP